MNRLLNLLVVLTFFAFQASPLLAWRSGIPTSTFARSQITPNAMSAEAPFLNLIKSQANSWHYVTGGAHATPNDLDSNGMPSPGSGVWAANGGLLSNVSIPGPFVISAHYVVTATGQGTIGLGALSVSNVSCTGALSSFTCNNAGCSSFTASSSGNTLNVSVAPTGTGCTLGPGVPISGTGINANKFGVAVFITSSGTTCGSNTCYTLNTPLNVSSESMTMGMRYEFTFGNGTIGSFVNLQLSITASQSGNPVQNLTLVQISDESNYWSAATPCGRGQACIVGSMFKTRIQQLNFSVMRDLDFLVGNVSNCSTWSTRKPINHWSYNVAELRNASTGTEAYTAGGHLYTIPKQGQYIDAAGDGASTGTVSYNAGTDTYAIVVNSGNFVDKQTLEVLIPSTGTTSSKISMNGNTAVPILDPNGNTLAVAPASGKIITFFYDQDIGGALTADVGDGIQCGMPPEVFIELCAELGVTPWQVLPYLALDPMTDWTTQAALYSMSSYYQPSLAGPIFEVTNEPFNCNTQSPNYIAVKSRTHIAADSNHAWTGANFWCGSSGNNPSEIGKMASTAAQDLTAVFGKHAEILVPVQTSSLTSTWTDEFASAAYIGQSMAAQTGYSQVAAYTLATRVSINDYWNTGYYGGSGGNNAFAGSEVGIAYCYFNYSVSAGCQALYTSQQAAMNAKMNSSLTGALNSFNIPGVVSLWSAWNSFGLVCGQGSRPGNCTINSSTPLMMYEGGYNETLLGADVSQTITAATNGTNAQLTITNTDGCVAGQTVALSNLTGGTWSGSAGSYTVVSDGPCTINLNSTSLGTLTGGTITYTGSANYVNYLREAAYTQTLLSTLTTTVYNDVLANGGINPSQFNLAGTYGTSGSWYIDDPNNWLTPGYPLAACTSCTIATTNLTLGGTITGIFTVGMVLEGSHVTLTTTITSCSTTGSGPCGSNSGDVLGLSQSSTVSTGTAMTGYVPPTAGGIGTVSPVKAFSAICGWNGNSGSCN